MTWHQWHQTALMESRIGRPLSFASSKALADHGCHLISAARFGRGEKWNSAVTSRAPAKRPRELEGHTVRSRGATSRRRPGVRGAKPRPHDKVTRVKQWLHDLDQRGRRVHREELASLRR